MKTYRIRVPITHATGERVYEVKARTFSEAVEKAKEKGQCVEEHIEADALEWEDAEDVS